MAKASMNFAVGTRVDCLYDDEYFRGTVDGVVAEHGQERYTVCFDDGDVRDNVPARDIALPLQAGCRIECLFEVVYVYKTSDDLGLVWGVPEDTTGKLLCFLCATRVCSH